MESGPLIWLLLLLASVTGVLKWHPRVTPAPPFSRLAVGDSVELLLALQGECEHLVVFHGSCYGCERFVPGREDAWWVTREAHPRDQLFPRVIVSRALYRALRVAGIPAEFLISPRGRVLYAGPMRPRLPQCQPNP